MCIACEIMIAATASYVAYFIATELHIATTANTLSLTCYCSYRVWEFLTACKYGTFRLHWHGYVSSLSHEHQ